MVSTAKKAPYFTTGQLLEGASVEDFGLAKALEEEKEEELHAPGALWLSKGQTDPYTDEGHLFSRYSVENLTVFFFFENDFSSCSRIEHIMQLYHIAQDCTWPSSGMLSDTGLFRLAVGKRVWAFACGDHDFGYLRGSLLLVCFLYDWKFDRCLATWLTSHWQDSASVVSFVYLRPRPADCCLRNYLRIRRVRCFTVCLFAT